MKIVGTADDATIGQLSRCVEAEPGSIGLLMADNHKGYGMPIGGVVGYEKHVSPAGVGFDIACGNLAVQTNLLATDMNHAAMEAFADEIQARVSFGVGRKNQEPIDDTVLDDISHAVIQEQRDMKDLAESQLGTVGSGNHYVDVLEDELGLLWVAVHFGSRGFGHKTASGFMNIAAGGRFSDRGLNEEMDAPPLLLEVDSAAGEDYLEAMELAGKYAYAGREAVVTKVLDILGAEATGRRVHNHHNFTWNEMHGGRKLQVVRKGATPAFPGQQGFVGGSMGDISVILEGVDSEASRDLLYSTVHGAGRVMSRTQAAGKQKWVRGGWKCGQRSCPEFSTTVPFNNLAKGEDGSNPTCPTCDNKMIHVKRSMTRKAGGAVDFNVEQQKLVDRGIVLRGAGADEAPPVYRPLQSVLDAHQGTINILHVLQPKIVVMAGGDEHDPYKD